MLSLYDYLGRAAGSKLGLAVAKYAATQGATTGIREVSTKTYTGPVKLYTEDFLRAFFNNPNYRTVIKEDNDLYLEKQKKYQSKAIEVKTLF